MRSHRSAGRASFLINLRLAALLISLKVIGSLSAHELPENLGDLELSGVPFVAEAVDPEVFDKLDSGHQRMLLRYAAKLRDGKPPLALCWGPSTAAEVVMAFHAVEEASARVRRDQERNPSIGEAFQADIADHWGTTATSGGGQGVQGLPVTLRWSIVPDGTVIPGGEVDGEGVNEASDLRSWLQTLYGGSATDPAENQPWFPLFQAVFDEVAEKTGVRYVYEPNDDGATLSGQTGGSGAIGVRGDVRISGHALDGNSGVLAYNYFPDFADMVIDTADGFYDNTSNNSIRLFNVLAHEHGHGLGLGHVCPLDNTKLMEPFINLSFSGYQFDDIYTTQRLYGDPLEVHGSELDNDQIGRATPLNLELNELFVAEWLGIDDSSDSDHFSFALPAGVQLSVRVIPSSQTYLEGEQNPATGNCTTGTSFDSGVVHDLSFEVLGSDQATVLASGNSQPAGMTESVGDLAIGSAGTYYLRVIGGAADSNQLYRLEVEAAAPSVALQLVSSTVITELFQVKNGVADPGETIALELELRNAGLVDGENIAGVLTGSGGVQIFDGSEDFGNISSGASATGTFILATEGVCGGTLDLNLQLSADGGYEANIPLQLVLGREEIAFEEDFDPDGGLPVAWLSSLTKKGSGWLVSSGASNSAPNAVFAVNESQAGSSVLTSPSIPIVVGGATLSFSHFYDTEASWDGGVVEINIGGGGWQDLEAAGGSFKTGGYNLALAGTNNPLAGRSGWSGNSGGYLTTEVDLPPAAGGQSIQLRWVLGHDNRIGGNGWYVDDVVLRSVACDQSGAAVMLSSEDTIASEFLADSAEVRASTVLPVPTEISVGLITGGTASAMDDLGGFGDLVLAVGSSQASLSLTAVSDGLVEGDETLDVTSSDASGMVTITVADTPYGQWAAGEIGTMGLVNPGDDFDQDGSTNVDELINGTDPVSPDSTPDHLLIPLGPKVKLFVPLGSLPPDVEVDAETSVDLDEWTTDGVTRVEDGFEIPADGGYRFIRLRYLILDSATP